MNNVSKFRLLIRQPFKKGSPNIHPSISNGSSVVFVHNYSQEIQPHFLTETTHYKRGRGGRSSFNGVVATIFGGSGYMGPILTNKLGKIGTQIIIAHRCDPYIVREHKVSGDLGQVLFHHYDLLNEDVIRKCIRHSNVVINLIGRDFRTKRYTLHQSNVDTAAMIAKVCKEMEIPKFIHMSALNCHKEYEGYITPGGSDYLKAKYNSELAVRAHFPEAVIFRPSNVWGFLDRFLRYYVRSNLKGISTYFIPLPKKGRGIWKQPVFINNLVDGIIEAAIEPNILGKTFDAVGPRRYELHDLVEWFLKVGNKFHAGITEVKYDPAYNMIALFNDGSPFYPKGKITYDHFEREAITDEPTGLPTLEDLGVTLTTLEERIEWELWYTNRYRRSQELGLYEKITPPKYIQPSIFS